MTEFYKLIIVRIYGVITDEFVTAERAVADKRFSSAIARADEDSVSVYFYEGGMLINYWRKP